MSLDTRVLDQLSIGRPVLAANEEVRQDMQAVVHFVQRLRDVLGLPFPDRPERLLEEIIEEVDDVVIGLGWEQEQTRQLRKRLKAANAIIAASRDAKEVKRLREAMKQARAKLVVTKPRQK